LSPIRLVVMGSIIYTSSIMHIYDSVARILATSVMHSIIS